MRIIIFLLVIISFCACNSIEQKKEANSIKYTDKKTTDSCTNIKENILQKIYDNLSAYKIKEDFGGTSEVTSGWSHEYYHEVDTTGFYGRYFLIRSTTYPPIPFEGELVIFTNNRPWKASDKNETFIELIAYTSNIKLTPDIYVGQSKSKVITLLGEPQYEEGGVLFYYDNSTYMLSLKIKNDTINTLRFGYYKEDVDIKPLVQDIIYYFDLRSI